MRAVSDFRRIWIYGCQDRLNFVPVPFFLQHGVYELFLLTVPIEEVAHWQYETVLIIFPLNRQAFDIAFDVVKLGDGVTIARRMFLWLDVTIATTFCNLLVHGPSVLYW